MSSSPVDQDFQHFYVILQVSVLHRQHLTLGLQDLCLTLHGLTFRTRLCPFLFELPFHRRDTLSKQQIFPLQVLILDGELSIVGVQRRYSLYHLLYLVVLEFHQLRNKFEIRIEIGKFT